MYYKIYLRNCEYRTEFVALKHYATFDEAKAEKITLESIIKLPKGYYFEIQCFYI